MSGSRGPLLLTQDLHFEGGVLQPLKAVNLHEVLRSGLCKNMSMNMNAKVEEFAKPDSGALESWKLYPGPCLHFATMS